MKPQPSCSRSNCLTHNLLAEKNHMPLLSSAANTRRSSEPLFTRWASPDSGRNNPTIRSLSLPDQATSQAGLDGEDPQQADNIDSLDPTKLRRLLTIEGGWA